MADGIDFVGSNKRFGPPPGDDRVEPLMVFDNGHVIVECWRLRPEELAEVVANGGILFVTVFARGLPPIFVGTEQNTRDLIQDYGGAWKR